MYESPLKITSWTSLDGMVSELVKEQDDRIVAYIKANCNIDVNRDELVKALAYDRKQYDKGYADGVEETLNNLRDALTEKFGRVW